VLLDAAAESVFAGFESFVEGFEAGSDEDDAARLSVR
jgi:hypothetical protein